jgi:hypothetical protein
MLEEVEAFGRREAQPILEEEMNTKRVRLIALTALTFAMLASALSASDNESPKGNDKKSPIPPRRLLLRPFTTRRARMHGSAVLQAGN